MDYVKAFLNLPFKYHLCIGAIIRLVLILYSEFHDSNFDVPYTDVDYKVFTDAARHVVNGNSPYKRHTYRYSPFIAYLMISEIVFIKHFGKLFFSFFDILLTMSVRKIIKSDLGNSSNTGVISKYSSLFWLYNPLSIAISTRGNADSLPCFLIILALISLQVGTYKSLVLSGIALGFSIHLRLYPLIFSFPMYLSLREYKIKRSTNIIKGIKYLIPTIKQVALALSCIITLLLLNCSMYYLYGYEFLFETYLYHFFRKDTRHNFSVLFYYSYLTMDQLSFDFVKMMIQIFEFIILFVLSLAFGCDPKTLPLALFSQAVVLVAFNSVMTSQYFVWFLSLLPLIVHNLKIKTNKALFLFVLWLAAQGSWLLFAYQLEFKCKDVFIFIWMKSVIFFCSNIYILGELIKSYTPDYGFGMPMVKVKEA